MDICEQPTTSYSTHADGRTACEKLRTAASSEKMSETISKLFNQSINPLVVTSSCKTKRKGGASKKSKLSKSTCSLKVLETVVVTTQSSSIPQGHSRQLLWEQGYLKIFKFLKSD